MLISMILDYDKDCCKKECPCAAVPASKNDDNFNMFVKLFKPASGSKLKAGAIEASPKLSDSKKKQAENLVEEMIAKLNKVISSN